MDPKILPAAEARRIIWLHDLCRLHVSRDCSLHVKKLERPNPYTGELEAYGERITVTRPLSAYPGSQQVVARGTYEEVVYQLTSWKGTKLL